MKFFYLATEKNETVICRKVDATNKTNYIYKFKSVS